MKQDGDRWKAYRLNNFSHNTLTYNGQLHKVDGIAKIISSTPHPEHKTIVDLTDALNLPKGATAIRTFQLIASTNPPSITITDEIKDLKPNDTITWRMITSAATTAPKEYSFQLTQDNKSANLTLESSEAISCAATPVSPPNPHDQIPNNHTNITLTAKSNESGQINIQATFTINP